jgi:hypothetical protein
MKTMIRAAALVVGLGIGVAFGMATAPAPAEAARGDCCVTCGGTHACGFCVELSCGKCGPC